MMEKNTTIIKAPKIVEDKDIREFELFNFTKKGTAIVWSKVDSAKPSTSKGLIGHIERNISRKFKYYIKGHKDPILKKDIKVNISIKLYEDNGNQFSRVGKIHKIRPFDSLFYYGGDPDRRYRWCKTL